MIAAAAADGAIDAAERANILAGLKGIGLDHESSRFLEGEFAFPASPRDIAAGVSGPEEASEVYTAARLAMDPDTAPERAFLHDLAQALRLDPGLVANLEAAASGVRAEASA